MISSVLVWAGLLGILDGVQRSADVKVLGLKEAGEPAAFISETHREHRGKRLNQAGVSL